MNDLNLFGNENNYNDTMKLDEIHRLVDDPEGEDRQSTKSNLQKKDG